MIRRDLYRIRHLRVVAGCAAVLALAVPSVAPAQEGLGLLKSLEKAGVQGPLNPSLYAGQCNFSNIPGIDVPLWIGGAAIESMFGFGPTMVAPA